MDSSDDEEPLGQLSDAELQRKFAAGEQIEHAHPPETCTHPSLSLSSLSQLYINLHVDRNDLLCAIARYSPTPSVFGSEFVSSEHGTASGLVHLLLSFVPIVFLLVCSLYRTVVAQRKSVFHVCSRFPTCSVPVYTALTLSHLCCGKGNKELNIFY